MAENKCNFYYSDLCQLCKNQPDDPLEVLKCCTNCKTVAYCSKEHQIEDWRNHKHLCKVIANTEKKLQKNFTNFSDFKKYCITRSVLWQNQLTRMLKPYESQMWMFPKRCNICFTMSNVKLSCENCLSVHYCSDYHKKYDLVHHLKVCDKLKLAMQIDCYLFRNTNFLLAVNLKLREAIPESSISVPTDSEEFLKRTFYFDSFLINEVEKVIISDTIIASGMVLYALDHDKLKKNTIKNETLCIHFVGSSQFEMSLNWLQICEILFHWIDHLSKIDIILIGPEVTSAPPIDFSDFFCNGCKEKFICASVTSFSSLYHEILTDLNKPNIVFALNSGLHEFENLNNDLWRESLDSLVYYEDVPLVITAYTEDELIQDLDRLKSLENIDIVVDPRKNVYANLRPIRDWSSQTLSVFYANNYISIVKRRN